MVNFAKWLIKIKKEKLKNITDRAARFAPAKNTWMKGSFPHPLWNMFDHDL